MVFSIHVWGFLAEGLCSSSWTSYGWGDRETMIEWEILNENYEILKNLYK